MEFQTPKLEQLKEIMQKDYGISLSDIEANTFGASLLRLTRLTIVALARADEKNSSVQAREKIS